jgi:hypothetical protein
VGRIRDMQQREGENHQACNGNLSEHVFRFRFGPIPDVRKRFAVVGWEYQ